MGISRGVSYLHRLPAEASFGIVASTRASILLKIRPLPRVFLNGTTSQEEVQVTLVSLERWPNVVRRSLDY